MHLNLIIHSLPGRIFLSPVLLTWKSSSEVFREMLIESMDLPGAVFVAEKKSNIKLRLSGCSPPILIFFFARQIGSFSAKFRVKITKCNWNHHLGYEAMKAFRAILVRKILVWKILYGDFCFCVGCFFGLFFWWDVFVKEKVWLSSNFLDVIFEHTICWESFLYFLNQFLFANGLSPDVTYGPPRDVRVY